MIITGRFNGIYYGEDVDKEVRDYMQYLDDYMGGEILIGKEVHKYSKTKYPDHWNIPLVDKEGNPTDEILALPKEERDECIKFWTREVNRIRKGYKDMCGLQYLYYNYGSLRGGRGEIKYRRS